jgi:hypothetical protein
MVSPIGGEAPDYELSDRRQLAIGWVMGQARSPLGPCRYARAADDKSDQTAAGSWHLRTAPVERKVRVATGLKLVVDHAYAETSSIPMIEQVRGRLLISMDYGFD